MKSEPSKAEPNRKNPVLYIVAGIVIVALVGGAYLVYHHNQSNKTSTSNTVYEKGPHNEDYKNLDTYKLDGAKAGAGISFEKPAAYVKVLESTDKTQVSFSHTLKSPPAPLGALHVISIGSAAGTTNDVNNLKKVLANPKQTAYKAAVQPMKDFLSARFSPLYDITYANAQPLADAGTQGRAWEMEFSAAPKVSVKPPAGVPSSGDATVDPAHAQPLPSSAVGGFEKYKGAVVMAVGKNAYYYFAVYNTSYNWDNDSSDFGKVISSIKIDQ